MPSLLACLLHSLGLWTLTFSVLVNIIVPFKFLWFCGSSSQTNQPGRGLQRDLCPSFGLFSLVFTSWLAPSMARMFRHFWFGGFGSPLNQPGSEACWDSCSTLGLLFLGITKYCPLYWFRSLSSLSREPGKEVCWAPSSCSPSSTSPVKRTWNASQQLINLLF